LASDRDTLPRKAARRRRDTKTEPSSTPPPEDVPTTYNPKQKRVRVHKDERVTTFRPAHHLFGPRPITTPPPPGNQTDTLPDHDSALEDKPKSTSQSFLVKPAIDTRARLVKSQNQPQKEYAIHTQGEFQSSPSGIQSVAPVLTLAV